MHTKLHTENSFTPHVTATRGPWHRDVPSIGVLASTKPGVRRQSEKRRLKINYPGSGNNSQFTYDGSSHIVQIVETISSTVTSTKQFVWSTDKERPNQPCEVRNSSGGITAQYFSRGESIAGTSYFYSQDHLGSITEMTNNSGNIQAQYSYDAYGRATKILGTLASDFQYAGYFFHASSGLNLTLSRAYSSTLGRWINRDPIAEYGGLNLYTYVKNAPTEFTDPTGFYCTCHDETCCRKNFDECRAKGGDLECCDDSYVGCLNRVPPFAPGGEDGPGGFRNCTRKDRVRQTSPAGSGSGPGVSPSPYTPFIIVGGIIIWLVTRGAIPV